MQYEFRVRGPVPENAAETLPELDSVMLADKTVFYGTVIDEAQLFGLLARFRMPGLLVTQMRPLPY